MSTTPPREPIATDAETPITANSHKGIKLDQAFMMEVGEVIEKSYKNPFRMY